MLKSIKFPISMNTSESDIKKEFFIPLLKNTKIYYRGVGYFSSGWLKHNSEGLTTFAENNGKIKWITSPILSKTDLDSFIIGEEAKNDVLLKIRLEEAITDLEFSLSSDTLTALSWMIADGIIEIRLAVPCRKLTGEFHDKFGYFEDEDGNCLSFNGSNNESINGEALNYESLTIFYSWHHDQEISKYSTNNKYRFERLWENKDENLQVYQIPDAVKDKITRLRGDSQRPYKLKTHRIAGPRIPSKYSEIRDYQKKAFVNWKKANYSGIFAMATGTGKTFTSLYCAIQEYEDRYIENKDVKFQLIVLVPTKTLVKQWEEELKSFEFFPIISAYSDNSEWRSQIKEIAENNRYFGIESNFSIVTTYTSFSIGYKDYFSKLSSNCLLIADEVHNLGSESCLKIIKDIQFKKKIGLSATPKRIYAPNSSEEIEKFYNSSYPYTFSYSMKEAIDNDVLTRYDYKVFFAELDEEEFEEYCKLTLELGQASHFDSDILTDKMNEQLVKKLIKRKRIINGANSKKDILVKIFQELKNVNKIKYCLVYAPGGNDYFDISIEPNDSQRIILQMQSLIKEQFPEIKQSSYLGETNDRDKTIESFKNGNIDVLFAINCLDEGVDIPITKIGIFTASSGNPRQYIQRRGRLLRKHQDKQRAAVYDMLVLPPRLLKEENYFPIAKRLVINELKRARYFLELSEQKYIFHQIFENVLHKYQISLNDVSIDEEFL